MFFLPKVNLQKSVKWTFSTRCDWSDQLHNTVDLNIFLLFLSWLDIHEALGVRNISRVLTTGPFVPRATMVIDYGN